MSDDDILNWADMLYDPERTRKEIIEDLLKYAKKDGMSQIDVAACKRALEILPDEPAKIKKVVEKEVEDEDDFIELYGEPEPVEFLPFE